MQNGRLDTERGERVNRRLADNVPQRAAESQAQDESHAQAGERPEDARAQFLQVLHERHAQHAVFFFVSLATRRRRGRRQQVSAQTGADLRESAGRRERGRHAPRGIGAPLRFVG